VTVTTSHTTKTGGCHTLLAVVTHFSAVTQKYVTLWFELFWSISRCFVVFTAVLVNFQRHLVEICHSVTDFSI